jgi:hypothetical protein
MTKHEEPPRELRWVANASNIVFGYAGALLTVTGLEPGRSYFFLPYWDQAKGDVAFINGDAGSPPIAHTRLPDPALVSAVRAEDRRLFPGSGLIVTTTEGTEQEK